MTEWSKHMFRCIKSHVRSSDSKQNVLILLNYNIKKKKKLFNFLLMIYLDYKIKITNIVFVNI